MELDIEAQLKNSIEKDPKIANLLELIILLMVQNKIDQARHYALQLVILDPLNIFALTCLKIVKPMDVKDENIRQIINTHWTVEYLKSLGSSDSLKKQIEVYYDSNNEERIGALRSIKFITPDKDELFSFLERIFSIETNENILRETISLIHHFNLFKAANFLYRFSQGFRVEPDNIRFQALMVLMDFLLSYPVETITYFISYQNFLDLQLQTNEFKVIKERNIFPEMLPSLEKNFVRASNYARVIHRYITGLYYDQIPLEGIPKIILNTYLKLKEIEDITKGIIEHTFTRDWISVGSLAQFQGDDVLAEKCLTIAIKGKNDKDMAYFRRLLFYIEKKNWKNAVDDLRRFIRYSTYNRFLYFDFLPKYGIDFSNINPKNPHLWRLLFYHFLYEGKEEESRLALKYYCKFTNDNIFNKSLTNNAWINWAIKMGLVRRCILFNYNVQDKIEIGHHFLFNEKQPAKAITFFEQAIKLDNSNILAHFYSGYTHYELGNYLEAEKKLIESVDLFEEFYWAWYSLVKVFQKQRRYEKALNTIQRSLHLFPNDNMLIAEKGWLLNSMNRFKDSLEVFNELLTIDPTEGLYGKACTYALMNNKGESLRFLRETIQKDSSYVSRAKNDTDFENIRKDPLFSELLKN